MNSKISERIEQLGIEVSESDTRSELLEKERQFNLAREKIENNLESFYRCMTSCIFSSKQKGCQQDQTLLLS